MNNFIRSLFNYSVARITYGITALLSIITLLPAISYADPPSLLDQAFVSLCIERAVARANLGTPWGPSAALRARNAGWLPSVSMRIVRRFGADSGTSTDQIDPSTTNANDSLALDVRVTFSLDRILYDNAEPSIARVELERQEQRREIEAQVIEALSQMERAQWLLRQLEINSLEALNQRITLARYRSRIETMTGQSIQHLLSQIRPNLR